MRLVGAVKLTKEDFEKATQPLGGAAPRQSVTFEGETFKYLTTTLQASHKWQEVNAVLLLHPSGQRVVVLITIRTPEGVAHYKVEMAVDVADRRHFATAENDPNSRKVIVRRAANFALDS